MTRPPSLSPQALVAQGLCLAIVVAAIAIASRFA